MAKLTEGVAVRNPETGEATFLPAGSEVPSWASELVGGHVIEKAADKQPSAAKKSAAKRSQ